MMPTVKKRLERITMGSRFRRIEFEMYEKWWKLCQKHETHLRQNGAYEDFVYALANRNPKI